MLSSGVFMCTRPLTDVCSSKERKKTKRELPLCEVKMTHPDFTTYPATVFIGMEVIVDCTE